MEHPLKEFLDAVDDAAPDFARRIGVAPALLQRIITGQERPTPDIARRIAAATEGAVSFEALYAAPETAVVDFDARRPADDTLDKALLVEAIMAVLGVRAASPSRRAWGREIEIAAEAAANTYATLARVTTRRDRMDRVAQALRPVLEEILKDSAASSVPLPRLDQAARRIAGRYCEMMEGRPPQ